MAAAEIYECEECGQLYERVLLTDKIANHFTARMTCERCKDQMPRCNDAGCMFEYSLVATENPQPIA